MMRSLARGAPCTGAAQGRMLWAKPPAPNTNVASNNARHTAIANAVRSLMAPSPVRCTTLTLAPRGRAAYGTFVQYCGQHPARRAA
jgi:hypothetical protein